MNKKASILLTSSFLLLPLLAAVTPTQALYPYVIAGKVVDYENIAFDASSGIQLTVRSAASGAVLAQSTVKTQTSDSAYNFRLDVPVASDTATGFALPGDTLTLTVVDSANNVYSGFLTGEQATVGRAGDSTVLRVMLSEDKDGNGVADEYEEARLYEGMVLNNVYNPDYVYDPAADDDGDGVTNYAEYLAGTDPFLATDYLRFTEAKFEGESFKVSFETNPGRSYKLSDGEHPEKDASDWKFKERVVNDSQTWGERTIYLIKNGDKCFYRLEVEL